MFVILFVSSAFGTAKALSTLHDFSPGFCSPSPVVRVVTTGSLSVNTLKTLVGLLANETWISSALKIQAGRNDVKNTIAKESRCGGLRKMWKCLEQQQSQVEQDCSLFFILGLFLVHSNAQMTWKAPASYLH